MQMTHHIDPNDVGPNGRAEKVSAGKLHAAQYIVAGILIVLITGLWRLQVLGADNFRALAEANRIRKVPILAPRGRLFDREGRLLVDNYPSVSCYLLREQVKDLDVDLPLISQGLHIPIEQIQSTLRRYQIAPKYQPIPLKQDISPDEQAFIAAHRDELPELETLDEQRRLYPRDGFAAHLIGYVGEVSEQMLDDPRYAFYSPGDVVGRSGVEQTYDALLRGKDGSRDVIVNSHGKELGHLGQELAIPGKDLKLTIDLDLQIAAEKALDGKNGAIVAMDPHTGEILAMVSRPTYDPNQFSVRLTKNYWNEIINNPDHPLLNKSLQAQLAPGSTFKIIMSVAGLQENVAQTMHVSCNGGAEFYGHFYACDKHHGAVDINNAIPYSCDTFYYTLANRLGIDTIAKYATSVGLGQRTGIDLPDEVTGTMPSTAWKLKTQHDKWFAGETISVGIGQGAVTATPMQLARALSGIASGGVFRRPHVIFADEVPPEMQQAIQESFPGSGDAIIPLTTENWQLITDAMANVTSSPIGTAYAAHLEGVDFAGKTGTAQVIGHDALAKTNKGHNTEPNAWFVGMAPRRNPDIVVAVLWEHGNWGNNSAKLASQIIDAYVNKQRKRDNNIRIATTPEPAKPAAPTSETPTVPSAE
ncbi:penicillin-binding protein 2 [Tunturibacter empetritectus]|uniref:Penicillin-binding protein 2 n=1 Tax=Tunturiibacter empetritectus TaxID=3069691 RepID=A0A7W8MSG9_9BACT|nr:penicillin-binding protein 2 [Edaphobacter lichenicola]MBB5318971.1 penicillin-binding protein 2 [Edaphobacter lichenicola]